jgi:hypothetical protein
LTQRKFSHEKRNQKFRSGDRCCVVSRGGIQANEISGTLFVVAAALFQLAHRGVLRGIRDRRNPRSPGDQGNRRTSGSQLLIPEKWYFIFSMEKITLLTASHARESASELVFGSSPTPC